MAAIDVVANDAHAHFARVEEWRAGYRDLWNRLESAWRASGGDGLTLRAVDDATPGDACPILVHGQPHALLASTGACHPDAAWLGAAAALIGAALATEGELATMTDELVDTYDQLTFLYEIARMLSSAGNLTDAIDLLLAQARQIVGADGSAVIIERADKPILVLAAGSVPEHDLLLSAHRVAVTTDRPIVANDPAAIRATLGPGMVAAVSSLVVAPISSGQCRATAACFGATKPDGFTAGNRKLMQAVVEQSIAVVERFALYEEQIRRSRIARDLELAAQIQTALLPGAFTGPPSVSLCAAMVPASEVGGDFYTYPERAAAGDGPIALAIGDVAGKGVAAALITTMCMSAMRAEMRQIVSPARALGAVSGFIAAELARIDSFVTCVLATYDVASRTLSYANAGHTPVLWWSATAGTLTDLPATGLPLGVDLGIGAEDATVALDPGDVLVFSTDGVTEAMSPTGAFFGDARLRDLILAHATREPAAISDAIFAAVRAFAPSQRDDITVVVLKVEA